MGGKVVDALIIFRYRHYVEQGTESGKNWRDQIIGGYCLFCGEPWLDR